MSSIFERCRAIAAHEVAEREGLELTRKGSRRWACCPFHGEKTPSMCFFADGMWKCFGCGLGGDSAALLAKLRGIPPLEAAKLLTGDSTAHYTPRKKEPTPEEMREANRREYIKIMHDSNAVMVAHIDAGTDGSEPYNTALKAYWWAYECIENLDAQTEAERAERWWACHERPN